MQETPVTFHKPTTGASAVHKSAKPRHTLVSEDALRAVQEAAQGLAWRADLLIEHLHRINDREHGLRPSRLAALAQMLRLSVVEVYEVASFYHSFRLIDEESPAVPNVVRVCQNAACNLHGAKPLLAALQSHCDPATTDVQGASCMGLCTCAPGVLVNNVPIGNATVESVDAALRQQTPVTAVTPTQSFDAYRDVGGYEILEACKRGEMAPADVIARVESAVLRGMGGSGFPATRKWATLLSNPGPRLMLVNLDEGEVGTCKDGDILRTSPHQMLEGMLVAAWTLSAGRIWIYLRDEYARERVMLDAELKRLDALGMIRYGGADIGGPTDDEPGDDDMVRARAPRVALRRGAGAYICGEESALIESLEGKRGMPRIRPPRMTVSGLFAHPTIGHNAETLWWIPDILSPSGDSLYEAEGRRGRRGMRRFTVSGRVKRPGVYLAPAGITVQELVEEYAGGMPDGWTLYGAMPGGASGGLLNAEQCGHVPLDFGTMDAYSCYLGSMAVMVMGQSASACDTAREMAANTMQFFVHESCGQCTPCREGTHHLLSAMAEPVWDAATLGRVEQVMRDASICGLGQAVPNLTDCVRRHFPHEISS